MLNGRRGEGVKLGDKKVYGLADNMVLLAKDEGARGVERLEEVLKRMN